MRYRLDLTRGEAQALVSTIRLYVEGVTDPVTVRSLDRVLTKLLRSVDRGVA